MPNTLWGGGFSDVRLSDVRGFDVEGSDKSGSPSFMKRWLRRTCVLSIGGSSTIVEASGETLAICSTKLLKTDTAWSLTLI